MIIVIDTRQQAAKHLQKELYFKSINVSTIRSKLIVGDYMRLDNGTVCIDTKKDILEIAGNICGKQHERFRNECLLAQKCGIKLIVLIEELPLNGDLSNWTSPKNKKGESLSRVNGATLKKCMATMTEKYGVIFEFATKTGCPKRIIEILGGQQ
jgi:ribosome-associated protein